MDKKREVSENPVEPHEKFRSWSNLPIELLLKIFNKVDEKELFWVISSVCRSWRLACWELLFWDEDEVLRLSKLLTLCDITDMGAVGNNFPLFMKPTTELDSVNLMRLALEKVVKSLFDPHGDTLPDVSRNFLHLTLPTSLDDEHLVYVAERVPKLQRIFLPMARITGKGFAEAVRNLTELDTISFGSISDYHYTHVIRELGINCGKLKILKFCFIATPFRLDEYNSRVMADNLHGLNELQLIGCIICKYGLQTIMSEGRQLVKKIILRCCSRASENVKVTRNRRALEAIPFTFIPGTLSVEISMAVNCNGWSVDTLPGNHNIMAVINHIWKETGDASGGLEDD